MNSNSPKRILVVQDNATAILLRQLLLGEGYEVVEAISGEQALEALNRSSIDLIILESTLPGMNGYDFCRQVRATAALSGLPIVMLTFKADPADKVAGFEVGIDDYLIKPFVNQELVYRVRLLLARSAKHFEPHVAQPAHGRVIALFGTKGGVGRTTIGVNLAIALQRRTQGKVVLVDADFFFGDIALHLNLSPSRTILDLIERVDQLDPELLDQVLVPHPSGIRVLMSPRNPEDVEAIGPTHLERLLSYLSTIYDYVIVDCQTSYDERTLVLLEKADTILLVIKPEVGCVKNMAIFSELAAKLGLPFDKKVHIVLNRAGSKSGIGPKEIERIFRRQIGFHIGSGGNAVVVSVNRGVPLMIEHPNHPFALQVAQIADYLIRNAPRFDPEFAAPRPLRQP